MTKIIFLKSFLHNLSDNDVHFEHLAGSSITLMLSAALVCFLVSEITGNYSQVDKLWSLMPIIYSLMALVSFPTPRLWIMSSLVTIWGFRLSFNFYRKGGYNIIPWKGEEDYRWKIIRELPVLKGRIRFGLFNLLFISFYQQFLILMFSTPLLMAAKYRNSNLAAIDIIAASVMLLFIVIETIADNQQFRFQQLKRQPGSNQGIFSGSLKRGFVSDGLWRIVRHPNFVSEQVIWISFYLFSVGASGKWINLTLAGPLLLVLLFLGSTELTERISSKKYPGYAAYKKDVPKYIPRLFRSYSGLD
jgi:steroid 5-alpha reductase family enzyme